MVTDFEEGSIARRQLILRDSLAIFSLLLGTVVLFAVTLFLFHSFTAHRAELAQRWSERGRAALAAHKPAEAIVALRTALTYAPGTRTYELLLAEALGEAGDTEESSTYFTSLWDAEPGNGFVNLELARLAAQRKERPAAVNYYRAAVYGTWDEGDGVARRADVRLELASYLIATHDPTAARMELMIAGGNAPDDYDRDMKIADLLQQAQDPGDAWAYDQKAMAAKPGDPAALEAAGRLAYQTGDYQDAHRLLARAQVERAGRHEPIYQDPDDEARMDDAARILEIMPLPTQPAREQAAHILAARVIARKRLADCSAKFAPPKQLPSALESLSTRWAGADGTSGEAALLRERSQQDAAMQLIYDTEVQTSQLCGAPSGDDALLLRLATSPHSNTPPGGVAQAVIPHD